MSSRPGWVHRHPLSPPPSLLPLSPGPAPPLLPLSLTQLPITPTLPHPRRCSLGRALVRSFGPGEGSLATRPARRSKAEVRRSLSRGRGRGGGRGRERDVEGKGRREREGEGMGGDGEGERGGEEAILGSPGCRLGDPLHSPSGERKRGGKGWGERRVKREGGEERRVERARRGGREGGGRLH